MYQQRPGEDNNIPPQNQNQNQQEWQQSQIQHAHRQCLNCGQEYGQNGISYSITFGENNISTVQCQHCKGFYFQSSCEICKSQINQIELFQQPIRCKQHQANYFTLKCGKQTKNSQTGELLSCSGVMEIQKEQHYQGKTFYRNTNCRACNSQYYYFYCQCTTLIMQPDRPFKYGSQIKCPNVENCMNKTLCFVKCPIDDCGKTNFWTNEYVMGDPVKCIECKNAFQHVECPKCNDSLYFDGDYKLGKWLQCPCEAVFQHINCPHCKAPHYKIRIIQNTTGITPGSIVTCLQQDCKKDFQYIMCPDCGKTDKRQDQFKNGKFLECENKQCPTQYSYYQCKQKHINLVKKPKQKDDRIDKKLFQYGEKYCDEQGCVNNKDPFFLIDCPYQKCHKINLIDEFKPKLSCEGCQRSVFVVQCNVCQNVISHIQGVASVCCYQCGNQVETGDTDVQSNLCVVCQTQPREWIITPCNHFAFCTECKENSHRHGITTCPLCRKKIVGINKVYYG